MNPIKKWLRKSRIKQEIEDNNALIEFASTLEQCQILRRYKIWQYRENKKLQRKLNELD